MVRELLLRIPHAVLGKDYGYGASEREIEIAAGRLGLGQFPVPYVEFLRTVGWIDLPEIVVLGVGSEFADVVGITLHERMELTIDRDALVISPVGNGDLVVMDASLGASARIQYWDHEAECLDPSGLAFDDFDSWLRDVLMSLE